MSRPTVSLWWVLQRSKVWSKCVHVYRIAFVSTSPTVLSSSTLDCLNSSLRAAKWMLQPPFQSNKVPLSAAASKSNRKVTIFGEETSRSACCTTSEPVSAIFLRLPGLAPDRRGSKEGDHPTIYIDRFQVSHFRPVVMEIEIGGRSEKSLGGQESAAIDQECMGSNASSCSFALSFPIRLFFFLPEPVSCWGQRIALARSNGKRNRNFTKNWSGGWSPFYWYCCNVFSSFF